MEKQLLDSLHGRRNLRTQRLSRDLHLRQEAKGFLITLFTNGTMINEKIADYLAEWPPFAIEITQLYGRTRETYEKLTMIPGCI